MISLIIEQLLVIFSVVCFLCGFISVSITSQYQPLVSSPQDVSLMSYHQLELEKSSIDKVVLVVIDALRADHIASATDIKMPYVQKLLKQKKGYSYITHTSTPTVTMPRIKSLLTGSIPGFMDVILNFDAGELKEDNIIEKWIKKGKRINFYGDDTWLRLFPNRFKKYEGVQSFFVSDYTDVDNNVTRNIENLKSNDWDISIFHYLGLDHIGHLEGPASPLMPSKLIEMDYIIKKIHEILILNGERYVLLVTGDHGMSDSGDMVDHLIQK